MYKGEKLSNVFTGVKKHRIYRDEELRPVGTLSSMEHTKCSNPELYETSENENENPRTDGWYICSDRIE